MTDLDVHKVNDFVLSIKEFEQTDMASSEANTKNRIIEPLLELLGWDLRSNEVRLEYPVRIGTKPNYVDYALMLERKPVVLVEAKAFDVILTSDHSQQIISYGRVEGVQWVVLTNGKALTIFNTTLGVNEEECFVTKVDLEELPNQIKHLRLISRESVLTGEIERASERLKATRRAIRNIRQKEEELADVLNKVLLEFTGPGVEDRVKHAAAQLSKQAPLLFESGVEEGDIRPPSGEVPLRKREELNEKEAGEVLLCPSRPDGVAFLKKYNAWGFVRIGKDHAPRYLALYVGRPESSVLYFGDVESITQPLQSRRDLQKIREEDWETFEKGKRVIHLKPGSLVKFKDPITLKDRRSAPRGIRYTTLNKLIQADHVEDL